MAYEPEENIDMKSNTYDIIIELMVIGILPLSIDKPLDQIVMQSE